MFVINEILLFISIDRIQSVIYSEWLINYVNIIVDPIRKKLSLDIYGFLLKVIILLSGIIVAYLLSFVIKSTQLLKFRLIVNYCVIVGVKVMREASY